MQTLSDTLHEHGDLDMVNITDEEDAFVIEYDKVIKVVRYYQETTQQTKTLCAFLDSSFDLDALVLH